MSAVQPGFEDLQQAADWFAVLQGGTTTETERLQWQRWLDTGPGQRAAWQRVEAVASEFAGLAGLPARRTLERSAVGGSGGVNGRRRVALRALAIVPVAGLAGWLAVREIPWRGWVAMHRTGVGERREFALADGSRVWLNTASAMDVDFSSGLRRIVLHRGEVMVASGHDDAFAARPLVVDVPQGRFTALGTRFAVRHEEEGAVRLAVFEGAVEARPDGGGAARTLVAGRQARVVSDRVERIDVLSPADGTAAYTDDWTRGMLVADGMRLGDFIAELGRYRTGYLGCAPEVADLRIVGAYPLADTDRILDALQSTLPVKVHRPMPWWTVDGGRGRRQAGAALIRHPDAEVFFWSAGSLFTRQIGKTDIHPLFCLKAAMPACHPRSTRPTRPIPLIAPLLARALQAAFTTLPVAAAMHAVPAMAQAPALEASRDYAIASGPLGTVLSQFAGQAGILLSVDASVTAGISSGGVRGRFTVDEGLSAALAGSGLLATRTGNVYGLQRSPAAAMEARGNGATSAASLPTVLVTARAGEETARSPVTGFVARRASGGTKTDTPLLETPQSVSVVTRDQMDAQGSTTLVESLRYTPGIVAQYANTDLRYDWLTLRGFTPPARYLDNLRLPFGARGYSQPRIEPWGLERVEVVKGPSSVLYGQATPGGLVNMVSKRPTTETVRQIELQAGSHNRKQAALDLGGALDEDGVWSYRLVALHREANTSFDHVSERKTYFAPSLTYKPSEATRITLLGQWQTLDSPGGGGAPALPAAGTLDTSRYAALPTRTFVGEPGFDRYSNRQRFIGYEAEHKVDGTFTVRQNLRLGKVDAYTQRIQAFCLAACNPSSLLRYAWAFPEESEMLTVDTQLQADFATGAVRHMLLGGVDFSNEKSTYDESNLRIIATPFNAYQPVYGRDSGIVPTVATHIDQKRRQAGFYLQDQMHIDRWSVVLGGRYDKANTSTQTLTTATGRSTDAGQSDGEFTGRAALMYSFDSGVVPYLSYSTSFQPSAGTDRLGNVFEPTTGKQTEFGVKYQPVGSKALFTAAVYELKQQNALTPDPLGRSFSEQTGEVRVRGLELEARGPIARGLDAIASYAYTDSRVTQANANAAGVSTEGNRFPYVPQRQAALWLDYAFQSDVVPGLAFGAGVRHISATYGDVANVYRVPGVTLYDAALRWDLGRMRSSLRGVRLALNIGNLADKKYVATCLAATGCYYGERRSVYVTAGYSW